MPGPPATIVGALAPGGNPGGVENPGAAPVGAARIIPVAGENASRYELIPAPASPRYTPTLKSARDRARLHTVRQRSLTRGTLKCSPNVSECALHERRWGELELGVETLGAPGHRALHTVGHP